MRNTFIEALSKLAKSNPNVFLLCGDLGYSVLEPFAERFPDRYLNVGIAEQNMTQVATGLAREGYNVFTYSIGNFPTLRCMEQIRYDVCYHEANVKIVAVGAGYAYGPQGVSHHTTEDLAMLRVIPNMVICAPADPAEAKAAAHFMVNHNGPGYIRINKAGEANIHDLSQPLEMAPGYFIKVREGVKTAVIATGAILAQMIEEIQLQGVNWAAYSAPFIGKYSQEGLLALAGQYERLITVEEHQLNGGFGSSIIEAYSDLFAGGVIDHMPRIQRVGIPNQFIGYAGSQDFLRQSAGITLSNLFE